MRSLTSRTGRPASASALRGAAGRDEFDAARGERLGESDEAGLVGHGEEGARDALRIARHRPLQGVGCGRDSTISSPTEPRRLRQVAGEDAFRAIPGEGSDRRWRRARRRALLKPLEAPARRAGLVERSLEDDLLRAPGAVRVQKRRCCPRATHRPGSPRTARPPGWAAPASRAPPCDAARLDARGEVEADHRLARRAVSVSAEKQVLALEPLRRRRRAASGARASGRSGAR